MSNSNRLTKASVHILYLLHRSPYLDRVPTTTYSRLLHPSYRTSSRRRPSPCTNPGNRLPDHPKMSPSDLSSRKSHVFTDIPKRNPPCTFQRQVRQNPSPGNVQLCFNSCAGCTATRRFSRCDWKPHIHTYTHTHNAKTKILSAAAAADDDDDIGTDKYV